MVRDRLVTALAAHLLRVSGERLLARASGAGETRPERALLRCAAGSRHFEVLDHVAQSLGQVELVEAAASSWLRWVVVGGPDLRLVLGRVLLRRLERLPPLLVVMRAARVEAGRRQTAALRH